jgi:hypothetical protein
VAGGDESEVILWGEGRLSRSWGGEGGTARHPHTPQQQRGGDAAVAAGKGKEGGGAGAKGGGSRSGRGRAGGAEAPLKMETLSCLKSDVVRV